MQLTNVMKYKEGDKQFELDFSANKAFQSKLSANFSFTGLSPCELVRE